MPTNLYDSAIRDITRAFPAPNFDWCRGPALHSKFVEELVATCPTREELAIRFELSGFDTLKVRAAIIFCGEEKYMTLGTLPEAIAFIRDTILRIELQAKVWILGDFPYFENPPSDELLRYYANDKGEVVALVPALEEHVEVDTLAHCQHYFPQATPRAAAFGVDNALVVVKFTLPQHLITPTPEDSAAEPKTEACPV